jgi:hypothetical protein
LAGKDGFPCPCPSLTRIQKGGLRLDTRAAAVGSGNVVPGHAGESPLFRLVAGMDPDKVMPPSGPRLTPRQVAVLRAWIDQGAPWPAAAEGASARPGHWAYRPLTRPPLPALDQPGWVRNPINAFILARLRAHGLAPAPPTDRATLLRRVSYDLIGLPPTPEGIDNFVNDPAQDGYERVVDRLLASPAYGERWGTSRPASSPSSTRARPSRSTSPTPCPVCTRRGRRSSSPATARPRARPCSAP